MQMIRSAIGLALLASVMAFGRAPSLGESAQIPCKWCSASGGGDQHEYGTVEHGVTRYGGDPTHGMSAGTCGGHHGDCNISNANKLMSLDRLAAVAEAGDLPSLEELIPIDGSIAFDREAGRIDVIGCSGRVIAVMWVNGTSAAGK